MLGVACQIINSPGILAPVHIREPSPAVVCSVLCSQQCIQHQRHLAPGQGIVWVSLISVRREVRQVSGALGHRPPPYLRHPGPPERRGYQDRLRHAGPLRCRIHSADLYPYHPPEAGRGSPDHGQPHGAGEITASKESQQRTGWEAELPCRCAVFFARCGSRPNRLL